MSEEYPKVVAEANEALQFIKMRDPKAQEFNLEQWTTEAEGLVECLEVISREIDGKPRPGGPDQCLFGPYYALKDKLTVLRAHTES